jgi:stage V sporulation protein G
MNITAVTVTPYLKDKLKAFVTITIDDCLVIRGIKVIEGRKGLFVAMPNRRRGTDNSFQDIAHPVTKEAREALEKTVLSAYFAVMSHHNGDAPLPGRPQGAILSEDGEDPIGDSDGDQGADSSRSPF